MFGESKKYRNNGHFFFKRGNSLKEVSNKVPELPGVFYVVRLARGKIDLVYIGKSGVRQSGTTGETLLNSTINGKYDGINMQDFFDKKMLDENIDGLDIYWLVTMDKHNQDLPSYVKGVFLQKYFDIHGDFPPWNHKDNPTGTVSSIHNN